MLASPALFFREDQDTNRALRTGLLASSVVEAIRNIRLGVRDDQERPALTRGIQFLRTAIAFCRGSFSCTADGVTSTEAFSALVAAARPVKDMATFADELEQCARSLEIALNGVPSDTSRAEYLFARLHEGFIEDGGDEGSRAEKWRL